MAGGNPSLMIGGQSVAGDHAMDVIMAQQGLTPCMQDRRELDLCAEPFWIGSHFEQGLRTGIELADRETALGEVSARGSVRGAR